MTINTKYSIWDNVWYMADNKVHKGKIIKINNTIKYAVSTKRGWYMETTYNLLDYFSFKLKQEFHESELYPSKEELLKSL